MTASRRADSGQLMGSTLIQLAILIVFGALLAAVVLGQELAATDQVGEEVVRIEQAAASAAADARTVTRIYFGVDPDAKTGSEDSIASDISEITRSLELFKGAIRSSDAQRLLAGRTLPDIWTELDRTRDRAESLERSLGAVETALDEVGGDRETPAKVADLVAHNRELRIRNLQLIGQLANLERRVGGVGKPPCWVSPDGQAEYTFKITITDLDFTVEPIWRADRAADMERIGVSLSRDTVTYDNEEFSRAMYPFLAFGAESDPECRFFVQVIDETGPYKDFWQERLALVEGYFYKYWVK